MIRIDLKSSAIPRPLWIAIATLVLLIVNRFRMEMNSFQYLGVIYPGVRMLFGLRVVEIVLFIAIITGFFRARKTAWFLTLVATALANYDSLSRVRYASFDLPVIILVLLPVLACSRWFFATTPDLKTAGDGAAPPIGVRVNKPLLLGCGTILVIFVLYFVAPNSLLPGHGIGDLINYVIVAGIVYAVACEVQSSKAVRRRVEAGNCEAGRPEPEDAQPASEGGTNQTSGRAAGRGLAASNIIVLLVGLALLVIPEYFAITAGYHSGVSTPEETLGNIFGLLIPFFGAAQLVLVLRVGLRWGRVPVDRAILAFALITLLQLLLSYWSAYTFGQETGRSKVLRARSDLRVVAEALDRYHLAHNAYPATLDPLRPGQLEALPQFPVTVGRLRYTVLDPANQAANNPYLLWLPGVDGKFDIQDGPELKAALGQLANGQASAWLSDRTYDPSNGGASAGDIYHGNLNLSAPSPTPAPSTPSILPAREPTKESAKMNGSQPQPEPTLSSQSGLTIQAQLLISNIQAITKNNDQIKSLSYSWPLTHNDQIMTLAKQWNYDMPQYDRLAMRTDPTTNMQDLFDVYHAYHHLNCIYFNADERQKAKFVARKFLEYLSGVIASSAADSHLQMIAEGYALEGFDWIGTVNIADELKEQWGFADWNKFKEYSELNLMDRYIAYLGYLEYYGKKHRAGSPEEDKSIVYGNRILEEIQNWENEYPDLAALPNDDGGSNGINKNELSTRLKFMEFETHEWLAEDYLRLHNLGESLRHYKQARNILTVMPERGIYNKEHIAQRQKEIEHKIIDLNKGPHLELMP